MVNFNDGEISWLNDLFFILCQENNINSNYDISKVTISNHLKNKLSLNYQQNESPLAFLIPPNNSIYTRNNYFVCDNYILNDISSIRNINIKNKIILGKYTDIKLLDVENETTTLVLILDNIEQLSSNSKSLQNKLIRKFKNSFSKLQNFKWYHLSDIYINGSHYYLYCLYVGDVYTLRFNQAMHYDELYKISNIKELNHFISDNSFVFILLNKQINSSIYNLLKINYHDYLMYIHLFNYFEYIVKANFSNLNKNQKVFIFDSLSVIHTVICYLYKIVNDNLKISLEQWFSYLKFNENIENKITLQTQLDNTDNYNFKNWKNIQAALSQIIKNIK
ncbi:hypothetical protein [Mycoplasmopsis verecunda]|uniref:hypothetical protein n=1 Tax=Mycoplasmopsis verecunda TaxID=171291 RepID=UPI00118116B0|nr:hypothetical protein [Mycoplasmopsis verecunda]WPB54701.1 hypothetical protein SAM46_00865 [Mycoplasmopsis verecunda]